MLRHQEGFVVIKLFKIKKNPNIKTFMQSHCVFLCLLRVLATFPMAYFREYLFTRLQRTSAITDPPPPHYSVLTRADCIVALWVMTTCSMVGGYQCFHFRVKIPAPLLPNSISSYNCTCHSKTFQSSCMSRHCSLILCRQKSHSFYIARW
jgi:hypothetical protein